MTALYWMTAIVLALGLAYVTGWLKKAFTFIYGDLTDSELNKFLLYGVLFFIIIGVYWELRCMKDSIFNAFIGSQYTAWGKLVSLLVIFPLVAGYSYLVDIFPRQRLFYAIAGIYAVFFFVMAFLLDNTSFGMSAPAEQRWALLGWVSYVMVESFGTLVVALFYSFMADTTTPESGKKGYFITATFGQLGAILGSGLVAKCSASVGVPRLMTIAGAFVSLIPLVVAFIVWFIPKEDLAGYQVKADEKPAAAKQKAGFVDGLRLVLGQSYLLAIFFVICAYEIVVTIFDLQFKILIAEHTQGNHAAFAAYSGEFGVYVSVLALISLLFGIGKVGRKIGLALSLALMPVLLGINIITMSFWSMLSVVFWIQVVSKGINYALGQPSKEQLFIPTSKEAKYKSKAWIDMFGSRFSKASGSGIKILQTYLPASLETFILMGASFVICIGWFFIALFVGRKATKAVENKEVIC